MGVKIFEDKGKVKLTGTHHMRCISYKKTMSDKKEIQILRLQKEDLRQFVELIKLFEEVFEMENFSIPNDRHLQELLNRDDFDAFVAKKNGLVVGGLTTYLLKQYYSEKPIAYIYDLAVNINYQRQGIGKRLIEEDKNYYLAKGFEDMFVQAEIEDDHAIEFYRSTSPSEEKQIIYFSYSLNK